MSFTNQLKKATLRTAFGYLEKNPEENALKLMSWVDKLAGDGPRQFPSPAARQSVKCWKTRRTTCISSL